MRPTIAVTLVFLVASTGLAQTARGPIAPTAAFGVPQATSDAPTAVVPAPIRDTLPPLPDMSDVGEPAAPPRTFALRAIWDNGLRFESDDGQFKLHVGGNAQVDSVWYIAPQSLFETPSGATSGIGNSNAMFIRRARLRLDGTIFGQFDYMAEIDFANAANDNSGDQPLTFNSLIGSPAPCNVWMQVRDVPLLGNVRAGYQVKPIGMTNNTFQALLPFMERADNMDAFYGPFDNGFAMGVTARNMLESERATWQFGVYRPLTNAFAVALNKYAYGGRITVLPWYADDGRQLIHLGIGTWDGEVVQDELRVRARPVLRNGPGFAVPVLVDTGDIPAQNQYTLAPEFALVWNSLSVQAEWCGQFLTGAMPGGVSVGTVFYHGGYVEVLYLLTGEYQPYEKADGVFGRIIPRNNYSLRKGEDAQGFGAWQVGARFSYLDLNNDGVQGGVVYDWTFGVNWILNPNMRVQLNYIVEHRNQPGAPVGWINGIGTRFGYDF
jgi:phosphate-selective porin OprO/OprP